MKRGVENGKVAAMGTFTQLGLIEELEQFYHRKRLILAFVESERGETALHTYC